MLPGIFWPVASECCSCWARCGCIKKKTESRCCWCGWTEPVVQFVFGSVLKEHIDGDGERGYTILGRHGSDSLCRDERENKMAATYNVLSFKR